jgi:HD-GYP domain-containing protein (c-di-GMP phosphodiesterase class II)
MLLSISDAMDLVSPELSRHQQRTAYISWQMAEYSGLPKEIIEKRFKGNGWL